MYGCVSRAMSVYEPILPDSTLKMVVFMSRRRFYFQTYIPVTYERKGKCYPHLRPWCMIVEMSRVYKMISKIVY